MKGATKGALYFLCSLRSLRALFGAAALSHPVTPLTAYMSTEHGLLAFNRHIAQEIP
jgi:hypothetical protein